MMMVMMMMITEMDIETSVHYVHLTRLMAREDYIKFIRRESTKTYVRDQVSYPYKAKGRITYFMF
jgi:hypothetical protein